MRRHTRCSFTTAIAVVAATGAAAVACSRPIPPRPTTTTNGAPSTVPTTGPTTTPTTRPGDPGTTICEKFGSTRVQDGRYIVQNNVWGADIQQCISVAGTGFAITSGQHNKPTNGAPGAYPSIYLGCHYGNCTTNSGLPAMRSSLSAVDSSVQFRTAPGQWNAAYDLWFDPAAKTDGQNNGAEIMVWVNHQGAPQPVGAKQATASIGGATWDVWFGRINDNGGWNVISYVRQPTATSWSGNLLAFADDAASRGHVQRSWYLTSVQFGFEPWEGGPGLAVNSFSASVR
jgi:hypothetical protein